MRKLLMFILCFYCVAVEAQNEDPLRLIQQRFVLKMLAGRKVSSNDTVQLDAVYRLVQTNWDSYVHDSLKTRAEAPETLHRLDAYTQFQVLLNVAGMNPPSTLERHTFRKYMLPSLESSYRTISALPTAENFNLIWVGALTNSISIGCRNYSDKKAFDRLYSLCSEFQELFDKYRSDPKIDQLTRILRSSIKEYRYDLDAKHFLLNGQPDLALSTFVTGLSVNAYPLPFAVRFAGNLVSHFQAAQNKDKCLAVLNTLMFYSTEDVIEQDTLLAKYRAIDGDRGEKLYDQTRQKISGTTYKTANSVSLKPSKWNLIANAIPQQKIAQAKYVLVDFWYSGCVPCIAEVPALNDLANRLADRSDIVFISINADYANGGRDEAYIREFAVSHDIRFPVVYDTKETAFVKKLAITAYPTKLIFDNQGRVVYKIDGGDTTLATFWQLLKKGS